MKITPEIKSQVLAALNNGESATEVGKRFNLKPATLRVLKLREKERNVTNVSPVKATVATDTQAATAALRSETPVTSSPFIKTVARPEGNVGAPTGNGAGGAAGARRALQTAETPPPVLDPLLLEEQHKKFCVETIASLKGMIGGGACLLLDINSQDKRVAPQLALSPIAQETVRANAEYLYPHLQRLFGNNLMLYMVLGMEAATMGSVIAKVYKEQHPQTPNKPQPKPDQGKEKIVVEEPMPNGDRPHVSQTGIPDLMKQSLWNPKNQNPNVAER